MVLTKKQKKRIKEIVVLFLIVIATAILWNTVLIFPIKLIVVFLHEASHSIAAIVTGGDVLKMNVDLNLGGSCQIVEGNSIIIASSGYLGSFCFGSLFFYAAYSTKYGRLIVIFIGIVILLFAVNLIENYVIQLLAVFFSVLLFLSQTYASPKLNSYLFKSLGLISCIYVIYDIQSDLIVSSNTYSDASALADLTGVPGIIWGIFWLIFSVIGVIQLFRIGYKHAS